MSIARVRRPALSQQVQAAENLVESQVPANRREEIEAYLDLFGYNPEHTILQVHVAGFFGRTSSTPRERNRRERAAVRYKGRTFTVIGTSHDPSLGERLRTPRKKTNESNPGYAGYLFRGRERNSVDPHDLLPLDFVPTGLIYPSDWKSMFATRGYLVALHVPSYFASKKSYLLRELRRLKGSDVKKPWDFLPKLEKYSVDAVLEETEDLNPSRAPDGGAS